MIFLVIFSFVAGALTAGLALRKKPMGNIRVAIDDVDGTYFFLEIPSSALDQIMREEYIYLRVVR